MAIAVDSEEPHVGEPAGHGTAFRSGMNGPVGSPTSRMGLVRVFHGPP